MVSHITVSQFLLEPSKCFLITNPVLKTPRNREKFDSLTRNRIGSSPFSNGKFDSLTRNRIGSSSFSNGSFFVQRKRNQRSGSCSCSSSDGDPALEIEVLEFMKKSRNPLAFPSKKELMNAGRKDLVEAILKQGGWLAYGWDKEKFREEGDAFEVKDSRLGIVDEWEDNTVFESRRNGDKEDEASYGTKSWDYSASSSGRSTETAADHDSGIDGILSRLQKERSTTFALLEKRSNGHIQMNGGNGALLEGSSEDVTVAGREPSRGTSRVENSLKPDTWRTWSMQRARLSTVEFEAAETSPDETKGTRKISGGQILEIRKSGTEPLNEVKERGSSNQLHGRVRRLKLELSSAFHSLRSNPLEVALQKENENSSYNDPTDSDSMEFQENEIKYAHDKIRSLRAKLAVLEGKMTLAAADAKKKLEEKQKKIDAAHAALYHLRNASIFWTSPAAEVLVTGSFDGWSTQRKMKKNSSGVFSLYLMLYPGRHEIKFIVDGEWKIDPLRPIVNNNGNQNNLLILS